MALNIKDAETDRLARELAEATGESITEAARVAIAERLARVKARQRGPATKAILTAIIARGRQRQVLDDRAPEEIIGYDENGLPV